MKANSRTRATRPGILLALLATPTMLRASALLMASLSCTTIGDGVLAGARIAFQV